MVYEGYSILCCVTSQRAGSDIVSKIIKHFGTFMSHGEGVFRAHHSFSCEQVASKRDFIRDMCKEDVDTMFVDARQLHEGRAFCAWQGKEVTVPRVKVSQPHYY